METTRILNLDIHRVTRDEVLNNLTDGIVFTPNIDHLVKLQSDREFYDTYAKADWVICDSRILRAVSRLLKNPIPEAIPGSSFFTDFYMHHKDDPGCRIFLLGAAAGIADKARRRINEKVGREIVVGAHSPSYGFEKRLDECEQLVDIVNSSGANVLVVGVGAPKQEKWIARYAHRMPGVRIFMGLGATIDFEAGTLSRAPQAWQNLNMEWLYRFLKEPKRLFRRYFIDDMKFFCHFLRQLTGTYHDPFDSTKK